MTEEQLRHRVAMEFARQYGEPIFPPLLDGLVEIAKEYGEEADCGSIDCVLKKEPLV